MYLAPCHTTVCALLTLFRRHLGLPAGSVSPLQPLMVGQQPILKNRALAHPPDPLWPFPPLKQDVVYPLENLEHSVPFLYSEYSTLCFSANLIVVFSNSRLQAIGDGGFWVPSYSRIHANKICLGRTDCYGKGHR